MKAPKNDLFCNTGCKSQTFYLLYKVICFSSNRIGGLKNDIGQKPKKEKTEIGDKPKKEKKPRVPRQKKESFDSPKKKSPKKKVQVFS